MFSQKIVKTLGFGALAGLIASIIMYPFLFLTTSMMGIPLDDLSIARGMAMSNIDDNYYVNLILGIAMHILTGCIAGVVFVIIVTIIKRFKISNYKKGFAEGVIYSIIIFIVLFIPTTMSMVQPNLLDIMKQSNPTQGILGDHHIIEQNLLPIYGFGFVAHIIFGIILGFVTSSLIFRRFII